jgi:hypothetical protein
VGFRMNMTSAWATKTEGMFLSESRHGGVGGSQGERDLSFTTRLRGLRVRAHQLGDCPRSSPSFCTSCHLKQSDSMYRNKTVFKFWYIFRSVMPALRVVCLMGGKNEKLHSCQGLWKPKRVSDLFTPGGGGGFLLRTLFSEGFLDLNLP